MIIRPRRLTPGYFRLLQVRGEQGLGDKWGPPSPSPRGLPAAGAVPGRILAPRWCRGCCGRAGVAGHPKITVGAALGPSRRKKSPPFAPVCQLWVHWGRSGQAGGRVCPLGGLGAALPPSSLLPLPLQMQLAAGRGAEPKDRALPPLALLLAAAGLCLSLYSARRMAGPAKAPPEP